MISPTPGRWRMGALVNVHGVAYVEIIAAATDGSTCVALVRWHLPESVANAKAICETVSVRQFAEAVIAAAKEEGFKVKDLPRTATAILNLAHVVKQSKGEL